MQLNFHLISTGSNFIVDCTCGYSSFIDFTLISTFCGLLLKGRLVYLRHQFLLLDNQCQQYDFWLFSKCHGSFLCLYLILVIC